MAFTYLCESPSMAASWDFRCSTLCDVSSQCSRRRVTARAMVVVWLVVRGRPVTYDAFSRATADGCSNTKQQAA